MRPGTSIRAAALAALVAVLAPGLFATLPHRIAAAAEMAVDPQSQSIAVAASDFGARSVALGVGKSLVIDFPRDIKDVLVANPRIANAVIRSSRRAYVIGNEIGQTNVFFFDAEGKQLAGFDIAVTRNLNGIRAAIKQVLPESDVRVEGIGTDGVILSGFVSSQAEAQQAFDINLSGSFGFGSTVVNFNNNNPFTALGGSLSGSTISPTFRSITGTLQAMEQAGVIHTLAEPNLTAISGETATFLAGGEFPILNGYSCSAVATGTSVTTCQPSIQFKKFAVSLNFTPVVLSEGRISLRVMTEVSDISAENALAVPIPGSTNSVTVPAIRTRRADTTVEIPSGGSLAMAGMIQNDTKHQINGLPGLMELPVLGPLFKSNDYINQQTELMVLVTPYVVHAVAPKDLSRPDDGFADPSDPAQVLLGRFNRIYGVGGMPDPPDNYRGKYGFILD
jgi:pilus assembly protein CpaC